MGALTRRAFLRAAGAAAGFPLLAAEGIIGCGREDSPRQAGALGRPNLLVIFPDQWRRQALGVAREDPVSTPNLDRFAQESLVCTDAVSNCPLCSPFRAMLMTGKYPDEAGVIVNCNSSPEAATSYLRPDERCLTDVLADEGYTVGYIGKWHLDRPEPPYVEEGPVVWDTYTPPDRRHGISFWYAYGINNDHLRPRYWVGDAPWDEPTVVHEWSPRHEAAVAISFLRNRPTRVRDPDKPFALFVAMNPPHPPWDLVPREYVERYEGVATADLLSRPNVDLRSGAPGVREAAKGVRGYFAAVTGVDEQVGRILRCLEEEGLAASTIVVFTSDHGEMMGSHGMIGKNVWYEESIGIPLLIRWPGLIRPRKDDLLISVPDLMPTLLGLMGLGRRIPPGVQGTDLSAAVLEKRGASRPSSALYREPWIPPFGGRGVRTHRYTYVCRRRVRGGTDRFLFDNVRDPFQVRNLASQEWSLAQELHQETMAWLTRVGDPWVHGPPG